MFWLFDYDFFGVPTLQSDEQPEAAQLFTLVTKLKSIPHKWMGGHMVPSDESFSTHEQREWPCLNCNLVRLTILFDGGANAERAYRYSGTTVQFAADIEPECRLEAVKEAKAS